MIPPMRSPTDTSWIQTHSGGRFYPLTPRASDVNLDDIAHALSNICRFNGQCSTFYSVAQHSVLVSTIVCNRAAIWGLLHDAAEAYICDLPRPMKRAPGMKAYNVAETNVLNVIAEALALPKEMPESVKRADIYALATEARDLMPNRDRSAWAWLPAPLTDIITPWSPKRSYREFLTRARQLDLHAHLANKG